MREGAVLEMVDGEYREECVDEWWVFTNFSFGDQYTSV